MSVLQIEYYRMYAAIRTPQNVTKMPIKLCKLSKDIYWEAESNRFYKITILQPLTIFSNQDVVNRQNLVMSNYDPLFLVLQELAEQQSMPVECIKYYLKEQLYEKLCDRQLNLFKINKNKVAQYLSVRIDAVLDIIQSQQYAKVVKKFDMINSSQPTGKRKISQQVIDILKRDIPQIFLDEVVRDRYDQEKLITPIFLDNFAEQMEREDEHDKNKIRKKATPKPKPVQPLPKNQPTLFQFSAKKQ